MQILTQSQNASAETPTPKPYNLRIYSLGAYREGVFLRDTRSRRAARMPGDKKLRQMQDQRSRCPMPPDVEGNQQSAGQRAKTMLRRVIEANSLGTMVSLTFDTNDVAKYRTRRLNRRSEDAVDDISDWSIARHYYLKLFMGRLRRFLAKQGLKSDVVGVWELQKRGVWHYHLATNLPLKWEQWDKVWGYGFVKVSRGRRRGQTVSGSSVAGVSAYMTKYLGKSLDARSEPRAEADMSEGLEEVQEKPEGIPAGSHRYYRSRNLELLYVEHLEEPGDMSAFQERMEAEGFKMVKEPTRIEKGGVDYGWWVRSVKVAEKKSKPTTSLLPAMRGTPL